MINTYTLEANASIDDINNCLLKNGLAILPNFSEADELEGLKEEFESILNASPSAYIKKLDYSAGRAANVDLQKLGSNFPVLKNSFTTSWMEKVKTAYLDEKASLNEEVFLVNDVVGSKHVANDMHFDVVPTFKFFLYLTDTSAENGAFACVPGSHIEARKIREKHGSNISYGNRELTRELPFQDHEILDVEGKAGTMILFTTEMFHRAGTVSSGDRRVIRGHCRAKEHQAPKTFFAKLKKKILN